TDTVVKSPRPPKRRTWTPTASASASESVSTVVGAERVSMTVAKAVGSARGASDTGGAVTTTSPRRSSALAACAAASTRSAVTMPDRSRIPSPFPAEGDVAGPSGRVFWLGDHPPPVPSRPVAVAATGLVPPHSCGAAGDSHPLPASDEVGRVVSARRRRRQALPTIVQSGSGPCRVPLASDESVIVDLLLALGLGLLVGFQRQAVHEP